MPPYDLRLRTRKEQYDGESDDSRGNDTNTVAAVRTIFYEALEQNKPEMSFIMVKYKYKHYLLR